MALTQAMTKARNEDTFRALGEGLVAVSLQLEYREVKEMATVLTQTMSQTTGYHSWALSQGLGAVLTQVDPSDIGRRATALVPTVGCSSILSSLATLTSLRPALAPLPCRLPDQELVELLKHPFCVGRARRVILDQLQNRHGRPFADQWDFVRFAKAQNLGLDFTTPPVLR